MPHTSQLNPSNGWNFRHELRFPRYYPWIRIFTCIKSWVTTSELRPKHPNNREQFPLKIFKTYRWLFYTLIMTSWIQESFHGVIPREF